MQCFTKPWRRQEASWENSSLAGGAMHITMYAKIGAEKRSETAAALVREREGHANEGWPMFPDILLQICTVFWPSTL